MHVAGSSSWPTGSVGVRHAASTISQGNQPRRMACNLTQLAARYPVDVARYVIAIAVACLAHGCSKKHGAVRTGACEASGRGDAVAPGFAKHGAAGKLDFKLVSATPSPPARGDNKWVVEVDAATGGALPHADVEVTPFMPDHGHGTPIKVGVTPLATPGQYELAPMNLWMPGYWEISVTASAGSDRDAAIFKLCIAD